MRRLLDILNEAHRILNEAHRLLAFHSIAAELTLRRGMTDGHVKLVDDAIRRMQIGYLHPSKTPGRVLFVPEPAAGFDDIEDRVEDLFNRLHRKFKLDPFNLLHWSIKDVHLTPDGLVEGDLHAKRVLSLASQANVRVPGSQVK